MADSIDIARLFKDLFVQTTTQCDKCGNTINGLPGIRSDIKNGKITVIGSLWCPHCSRFQEFAIKYDQK